MSLHDPSGEGDELQLGSDDEWASEAALNAEVDEITPVDIRHARDHKFVKEEQRGCGHRMLDDVRCGKAKDAMLHVGTPQSLNMHGSTANAHHYQAIKKHWSARLHELLDWSGLQRGLGYVLVEGQCCFPDRIRRDQGNFRYLLEKALGDVLTEGGWLDDDSWDFYEFGRLRKTYEKGVSWTALTLYPRL